MSPQLYKGNICLQLVFQGNKTFILYNFFNLKTLTNVFATNYCSKIISRMTVRTKRMLTLNIDRDRIEINCARENGSLLELVRDSNSVW